MSGRRTVAVVGAGFSGLLTALRLLIDPDGPQVILIERGARFGRGAAYSTSSPHHLLNVRAVNMSAFVEHPGHFLDWLRSAHGGAEPIDGQVFVTRDRYGRYLQAMLREATREGRRLVLEHDEVNALEPDGERWRLSLGLGRTTTADVVVLALGNLPPPAVIGVPPTLAARGAYVRDPWAWDAARTPAQGDVLLLGSGLTAVDIALSIHEQRPEARILALSRHGLSPRPHTDGPPGPPAPAPHGSPLAALRQVRARGDWRGAIDSLRPHVQAIWRDWSLAERRVFLRHLRPFWDVHRHRLAPQVADRIEALRRRGIYTVAAGRLGALRDTPTGIEAAWRPRGGGATVTRAFALAVNCTGPRGDVGGSEDGLIRRLLAAGLIRPDACQLGLDVDAQSQVIGADGRAKSGLYAVGPLTRGQFYEITSVPDIRVQAADCAAAILALLRARPAATPAGGEALIELNAYIDQSIAELDVELAAQRYARRLRNAWEMRGRRAALSEIAAWLDAWADPRRER